MKFFSFKKIVQRCTVVIFTSTALIACDVIIDDTDENDNTGTDSTANCDASSSGVNWDALLTKNCQQLSGYNLFANSMDPTANPNAGGIPYDLSTALFTDYASKYRFVFIPGGSKINYSEHEVLDFPVGTVLVKTFSMPEDTAFRDGNERVIETRLLIHRENGWVARPYYWGSIVDATLSITGEEISEMTTIHNGEELEFTYSVPSAASCTSCHSVVPILQSANDTRESIFKPIGPKSRFLNKDYDYGSTVANQLVYWQQLGVLNGLPSNNDEISQAASFSDLTDIDSLSTEELMDTAKSYLDVNCAHCHRSELTLPEPLYAGPAGGSGLQLEYNRGFEDDPLKFGVCKTPVAGGHSDYSRDVVPLDPDDSYLLFRMSTIDERHKMPELGRAVVHAEGVALIRRWIENLPEASCSPAS